MAPMQDPMTGLEMVRLRGPMKVGKAAMDQAVLIQVIIMEVNQNLQGWDPVGTKVHRQGLANREKVRIGTIPIELLLLVFILIWVRYIWNILFCETLLGFLGRRKMTRPFISGGGII
jgi:hypothetical protein